MRKIFKLAAFAAALFILLESVTRLFFLFAKLDIEIYRNYSYDRMPVNMTVPDDRLLYRFIPNVSRRVTTSDFSVTYSTNRFGLREKEIDETAKGRRILFLGDSYTFGEGVSQEDRFTDLIGKKLADVTTVNAGAPGYSFVQMYRYLKYFSDPLKPDFVICVIKDVSFLRSAYGVLKKNNLGKTVSPPHIVQTPQEIARLKHHLIRGFRKSYLYSFFDVQWHLFKLRGFIRERDQKLWAGLLRNGEAGVIVSTDEQREVIQAIARETTADFKKWTEEKNIPVLFVNIGEEEIPWFQDLLKEYGMGYLDLSSELRKLEGKQFFFDPHYNEIGHAAIADLISEHLVSRHHFQRMEKPEWI